MGKTKTSCKKEQVFARGWSLIKVGQCLKEKDGSQLAKFIKKRHEERFLKPLHALRNAKDNSQGYGFSIISICCLLIETMQSYKGGLPTTYWRNFDEQYKSLEIPEKYKIPKNDRVDGRASFINFFKENMDQFSCLNGADFYNNVRNGLLHQGQTKSGWIINKNMSQDKVYNNSSGCHEINRDLFSEKLRRVFDKYIDELKISVRGDDIFEKAKRKVWWLIEMSH